MKSLSAATFLACIVVSVPMLACKRERPPPPTAPSAVPSSSQSPQRVRRAKRGGTDVTFLAISDTHFGYGYPDDLRQLSSDPITHPVGLEADNMRLIARANAIAGRAYPAKLGGTVDRPRGVLAAGDLTEWGRPEEWSRFVACYGLTGAEGALKLPMFEAVGNHDKVPGPWIEGEVAKRHGARFYSWDWDDVHFASMGEAPDDEGLGWLARDLDGLERNVPVVVYFHFALEGPYSTGNWFGDGDYKERLANVLAERNVIAIIHGHHHATGHYVWHGIDVYKVGAVKNGPHLMTVVHVKDERMTVARFDYDADAWGAWEQKALGGAR